MEGQLRDRIGAMAASLWWGSLTGLGLVVVLLFRYLDSPQAAGALAARLFSAQTWLSSCCALLMLIAFNQKQAFPHVPYGQTAMKFIVGGLLAALLVEFGISPRIASARVDGGNLRLWHSLGSAMLIAQWLCAGYTVWSLSRSSQQESLQQP